MDDNKSKLTEALRNIIKEDIDDEQNRIREISKEVVLSDEDYKRMDEAYNDVKKERGIARIKSISVLAGFLFLVFFIPSILINVEKDDLAIKTSNFDEIKHYGFTNIRGENLKHKLDTLDEIKKLYESENYNNAEELIIEYLKVLNDGEYKNKLQFYLAECKLQQGKFKDAKVLYLNLLSNTKNFPFSEISNKRLRMIEKKLSKSDKD